MTMTDNVESDRLWAMICHLSALLGYCVPLGNIIAPLVVWLAKRDQSSFINEQGKEAINFQITMTIAFCVSAILMIVVIGFILMPIVALINLILVLIAGVSVYKGESFRYPFCLRFVR